MEKNSSLSASSTKNFSKFNLQIICKFLDEFLVFWMDNLLIYTQIEKEHLKHLQLV